MVDCINGQFIVCRCSLGVAFGMGGCYSCHTGLDTMKCYLIFRAVVLANIYGICFATLPKAVTVAPR